MENNPSPIIIFFHQGFSPYLAFSLHQARLTQPNARIILLGDESNRIGGLDYEHRVIPPTSGRRTEFLATYRHFHPGHLEDERRCIERWLILAEFLKEVSLPEFLFLDSDMLLFQDLRDYLPTWRGWDAAGAPLFYSFCFFPRPRLVIEFADWILGQYRDPKVIRLWEIRFQRHRKGIRQDAGIIQDMELCRLFVEAASLRILDVTQVNQNGWLVDTGKWGGAFLQGRASQDRLAQRKPGRNVEAREWGAMLRFLALHVQGFDKSHISGFTGWSRPVWRAFFRPNYRKNLKYLLRYLWNGARCRFWLSSWEPEKIDQEK
jgi:hypothetical protein